MTDNRASNAQAAAAIQDAIETETRTLTTPPEPITREAVAELMTALHNVLDSHHGESREELFERVACARVVARTLADKLTTDYVIAAKWIELETDYLQKAAEGLNSGREVEK